jgi:predicted nuclease of predicted toxin-antitoxin system
VHVGEIGAVTFPDADILCKAREDNRVVVTMDADFHALLALSGATAPSVIRIRVEGLRSEALSLLLQAVIERCAQDLECGAAVTVQEKRLRIRRLPLIR